MGHGDRHRVRHDRRAVLLLPLPATATASRSIPLPADRLAEIYPPTYYSFAGADAERRARASWTGSSSGSTCAATAGPSERLRDASAPRILDVGGGTGEISATLRARRAARQRLRRRSRPGQHRCWRGPRASTGSPGRSRSSRQSERFDLVLMLNLIEHVADPVAVLGEGGEPARTRGADLAADAELPGARRAGSSAIGTGRAITARATGRSSASRGCAGRSGAPQLEVAEFRQDAGGGFWAQSLLGLRRERLMRRRGAAARVDAVRSQPGRLAAQAAGPLPRLRAARGPVHRLRHRRLAGLRPVSQVAVLARGG